MEMHIFSSMQSGSIQLYETCNVPFRTLAGFCINMVPLREAIDESRTVLQRTKIPGHATPR